MSVWRIASEGTATPVYVPEADDGVPAESTLQTYLDRVVKWVPGDVLALYAAGVTAIGDPRVWWLVFGILFAPALVVLVPFASSGNVTPIKATCVRALLATIATIIWTLTIPASGWQRWDLVRENPVAVSVVAAALGLVFGLVAEGVSRRLRSDE
jgi:hypothetical protein